MKNILLYIALLITFPLMGQSSFLNDTIKIREVVISRKKFNSDPTGFKKVSVDSLVLKNYSHGTIAGLLSESSNIFIKSYGIGGTATPSFRGTGASHTQLAWNNININSPMLGQSDLSLIPAGLIDDIQIYFGGASMTLNSGGIGGIINLETKPVWKKQTLISINPGIGSFGQFTGLVKVVSGTNNFQTATKAYLQSAENNFRYLNPYLGAESVLETMKSSQVRQQGFIQELYYRSAKNQFSASIWYQAENRNIPGSMIAPNLNDQEKQIDESFRTIINYNILDGRRSYLITGAFMLSNMNYLKHPSIDSRNLSETYILKALMENRIYENIKLKVEINEELSAVKTNNYEYNPTRNTATITASAETTGSGRFGETFLVRGILDKNTFLLPDFSAGIQFRLLDGKEYFLKANISRNSKIPTLNDLFWKPGGNSDLKNEYAFIYELNYEMNQKISNPINIKYDLSLFRNIINDMIEWHLDKFSYWNADNIQNVKTMGLESSILIGYSHNNIKSTLKAGYSFTNAVSGASNIIDEISIGKQLMYVPKHQANGSLNIGFRNLYFSWVSIVTGRRYSIADISMDPPGYFLNNIMTGIKLKLKTTSVNINFTANNLFNVNYQTIAYYPLPGRSYSIKLLIQIPK